MKFRPVTLLMLLSLVAILPLSSCTFSAAPPLQEGQTPTMISPEGLPEGAEATAMEMTAMAQAVQSPEAPVDQTPMPLETPQETPTVPPMTLETGTPTEEATALPQPTEVTPLPTEVTPLPTLIAQPSPAATTPPAVTGGATVHVVQPGENLFRIALRYGLPLEVVAQANNITNPARIYVGQRLTIPASGTTPTPGTPVPTPPPTGGEVVYIVQPGDNLFRIALRYNMSYLYLAQYNGISNVNYLYAGQKIRIPVQK